MKRKKIEKEKKKLAPKKLEAFESSSLFLPEPFLSADAYPTVPRLVLSNRMLPPISCPNQGSVCWLLSRRLWHLLVRVRAGSSLVVS